MNRMQYTLILMSSVVFWSHSHCFSTDKPALDFKERSLVRAGQGVGMLGGATGLGILGAGAGFGEGAVLGGVVGGGLAQFKTNEDWAGQADLVSTKGAAAGLITGSAVGVVGGAVLGYKAGKRAAIAALAKYHGVGYRIELVSEFYDINLQQYGTLLKAAYEKADFNDLNTIVNELFTQRFGADWKEHLNLLFSKYKNRIDLFMRSRETLPLEQRNFVRFMQLGAAGDNLYFNMMPQSKNIIQNATRFYKKLGLL